ncbi:MAG: PilZ domain-containing protein [Candidatus Omnitrophica bacterium]|nr:PilZ domain-containing protein [Candidatus Omnitrophota bacterium]
MQKSRGSERRQFPRIDHELPMKVAVNGYDFVTSSQNISCVGAYCCLNKYIPPFTKVMVKLNLPIGQKKRCRVECKGVIVRSEDEAQGGFNVAIFFNDIRDEYRHKISQYIDQLLSSGVPSTT